MSKMNKHNFYKFINLQTGKKEIYRLFVYEWEMF